MSSNPLMMDYEGGDLLLAGPALAGGRAAAQSLWVQAVGVDLTGLAAQFQWREHIRGVYTRYVLYKLTALPLPFFLAVSS